MAMASINELSLKYENIITMLGVLEENSKSHTLDTVKNCVSQEVQRREMRSLDQP